jgi:TolB-like protein/class 3 adenylate cyclase/tetratricopeptide (TPR) repeat protein
LSPERVERRLTAILAADVTGYSRLMGADEEGTLAQLKAHRRELVDPKIAQHRGRIVKTTGDGMLVEFASVVDALRCAVEVQRGMIGRNAEVPQDKRIEFRVGINVGDIIIDGDDIYGDGVNVAARLEGLAEPGGICVSGRAQEDARGKLEITFEEMGEQKLKNIERPLRVCRVKLYGMSMPRAPLPLPDKPSVAVLPFQNMSGDPEQEYFADGIVEEIITALSRFRHLFVIARNSTFTYKGRAVDVKQVGRELGVRYVLEGGVRKAGDRVRITAQLVDALTGAHLWADRFDGALDDIFGLQDRVTASVVGAIAPKLEQVEINRATRKPTESLDAYDYYLRGIAIFDQYTREATDEALQLFYRAIELDPGFASAHGLAAWCYLRRKNYGWMTEPLQELAEAERVARRAVELGKDDAVALCSGGYVLARLGHSLHASAALIDRALNLNSNLARGWFLSGWVRNYLGEPEVAIEHFTRAIRLNPLDPLIFGMQTGIAAAHFLARRYDESSSWAERAILEHSNYLPALRMAAASHALAGRLEAAQQAMARMRQADPNLRISTLTELLPFRGPEDCARYEEGLRKAGLPE